MRIKLITAIGTLTLGAMSLFAQAPQSFTGSVTDSMCGAKHMMKNTSAAECTRKCVNQGADYALASGDKVYTLKGDKTQFEKLAGQKVTIKGKAEGNTIVVDSIVALKS